MAKSNLLVSILFLCLIFTVSLADTTTTKEEDDITTQFSDSSVVPLTRLTFRTVNRRFPLKPIHYRRVEVVPYGDFENLLYDHHHHHHHHREDDKVGDHRVMKRLVFKRSDLDRFDGDEMLDRIRKHRHSYGLMNRVRKFLD